MRLGLVCLFAEQPIKFRRTTAKYQSKFSRADQKKRITEIILHNGDSLLAAVQYCKNNSIGAFRVNSQIWPLKTHPQLGYDISELPESKEILRRYALVKQFAEANNIRTLLHPDQFVVLSSPRQEVVEKSILELEYQAELAMLIGADILNIHAGGAYNDKPSALERFSQALLQLSQPARNLLTIENDDISYSPSDLLPLCNKFHLPLIYDVHHHRCNPDGLSIAEATKLAIATWDREPVMHISSPRNGWDNGACRPHSDYINFDDFPDIWRNMEITIEVEAKAKELAVLKLRNQLQQSTTVKV